jgi:hypothetical protein
MNAQEILEGNKLIAEFMGVKIGEDKYSWRLGCYDHLQEYHLNYHASWGWLMPVVEKIEGLTSTDGRGEVEYIVCIQAKYCNVSIGGEGVVAEEQEWDRGVQKIQVLYETIIKFIKYYNQ